MGVPCAFMIFNLHITICRVDLDLPRNCTTSQKPYNVFEIYKRTPDTSHKTVHKKCKTTF